MRGDMSDDLAEISHAQVEEALARVKEALPPEISQRINRIVRAYLAVIKVVEKKNASIKRLQRMLFGSRSEKTKKVLSSQDPLPGIEDKNPKQSSGGGAKPKPPAAPKPGHGRNGQDAYWGAELECIPHHTLKSGERCPECLKGKIYEQRNDPAILVRITGRPPLGAKIYHLQRLRCNLCQEVFPAKSPKGVGEQKYDATAASMIAIFKYGGGFPWSRLQKIQDAVGIPLAASTQWGIVRDAAQNIRPAYEELERQAAQGSVLYNDDTVMRILDWMGARRDKNLENYAKGVAEGRKMIAPDRTGIFTSGIVSEIRGWRVALFYTGRRHAGENLANLLGKRDASLRPPIQMCDALSRNLPKDFKTIVGNCLAHGRRKFVDSVDNFPAECEYILDVLGEAYKNDATAKRQKMTAAQRLKLHQERSAPPMMELHDWMQAQIAEKKIEPNSGMGEAIGYLLKHWENLTLFLRKAGAPLDNNLCERVLKRAILHRKNSLFYKTDKGAGVGDIYMSLIHTCSLNGADPFDYLNQLQRHPEETRKNPERWMPWNYPKANSKNS